MYFNDREVLQAMLIPALFLIGIGAGIGWLLFS